MSPVPGRHLFVAQSSLHFLLAAALAQQAREEEGAHCEMLFVPSMLSPELFAQTAADWADSPFARIHLVQPRGEAGRKKTRSFLTLKHEIEAVVRAFEPTTVLVFNDRTDSGQTALIETARRFPHALRAAAEDGAQAYTGYTYQPHSAFTRLRQRLRQGPGWTDVRVLGTHRLIQRFYALYPDLLRPELRGSRVRQFPTAQLSSAPLQQFAVRFCQLSGFDPQYMPGCSVILTPSHSLYAQRSPDYVRVMQDCVNLLRRVSIPFLFKYHPRELEADYLNLSALGQEVPRAVPAECFYMLARDRAMLVLGGMSTALLSARLLLDDAQVVALEHASDVGDTWDDKLLKALDIRSISDASGLARLLERRSQGVA